jgi:hypothetical protein
MWVTRKRLRRMIEFELLWSLSDVLRRPEWNEDSAKIRERLYKLEQSLPVKQEPYWTTRGEFLTDLYNNFGISGVAAYKDATALVHQDIISLGARCYELLPDRHKELGEFFFRWQSRLLTPIPPPSELRASHASLLHFVTPEESAAFSEGCRPVRDDWYVFKPMDAILGETSSE